MKRLFLLLALGGLLVGCQTNTSTETLVETNVTEFARTSSVNYVCIGMETSARFGSCPGCHRDSSRMDAFLKSKFGYTGILLQSEQATRDNVVRMVKEAIRNTPSNGLFILYYSGHGGQERLNWNTEEPEGADAEDEYLCLYDTYLLDNEIWELINACEGRVFLCFDACHSQTMYRSVKCDIAQKKGFAIPLEDQLVKSGGFVLRPRGIALDRKAIEMLCWSGCLEKEYSYGSAKGGVMTNAILNNWTRGIHYKDLWEKMSAEVRRQQPTQHPAWTCNDQESFQEAFR